MSRYDAPETDPREYASINLRVPDEWVWQLRKRAADQKQSMSDYLRAMIARELETEVEP